MLSQGDKVFFAHNVADSEYSHAASDAIKSLQLVATIYDGLTASSRASTLDREARDDFYKSKVAVLLFSSTGPDQHFEDHWGLPELSVAERCGLELLVYVVASAAEVLPETLDTKVSSRVTGPSEFGSALRDDLLGMMAQ